MFRVALLLAFLLVTNNLSGQNNFKRSDLIQLKKNLQNSKDIKSRVSAQLMIGKYYLTLRHGQNAQDNDSAAFYFHKSLLESKSISGDEKSLTIEALCMLGELEFGKDNADSGLKMFDKALLYQPHQSKAQALLMVRAVRKMFVYLSERQKTRPYIERAIEIFRKERDFKLAAEMAYANTVVSLNLDNILTRKLCSTYMKEYQRYNAPWAGKFYFILSSINRYEGKLDLSLKYILTGIKWMNKTGDLERQDIYYGELGQVYQELGQTEKSIAAYRKTIAIRDTLYIKQRYLIRTIGFVAEGLIKLKKPKEALLEILSFEKRHEPDGNNEALWVAQIKANCYNALGDFKLAEKYYLKVISLYNNNDTEINSIARYDLAKFYVQQKNYVKAKSYLQHILYPETPASLKKNVYYLLHQIDSAAGNFTSALANYKTYKALNDSLFNMAKIHEIEKLQVQFETNQKEQDIKLLKQEKLIQVDSLNREKTIRNITIIGIFLLIIFIVFLYRNYLKNVANNLEIKSKNEELNILLTEKQWLVKEIHHRVKNNLQIVTGLLHSQSSFIKNKDALKIIKDSERRIQSIALIHQKLYQTDDMVYIDIHTYINDLVSHLKDSYSQGRSIQFKMELTPIRLNVSKAVPLALILNEAITNALKYAHNATSVTIFISLKTENLRHNLLIKDNGAGLPENWNLEEANSMGMNLMKGLSRQLDGTLHIFNEDGLVVQLEFDSI